MQAISIVQRGNLKTLETTLRKQWRLGQNIVLCWSADERGLLVVANAHVPPGSDLDDAYDDAIARLDAEGEPMSLAEEIVEEQDKIGEPFEKRIERVKENETHIAELQKMNMKQLIAEAKEIAGQARPKVPLKSVGRLGRTGFLKATAGDSVSSKTVSQPRLASSTL